VSSQHEKIYAKIFTKKKSFLVAGESCDDAGWQLNINNSQ
jgi:hypothetical protein